MKSRLLLICYSIKHVSLALFVSLFLVFSCDAQSEISVIHSISDARMPLGDHGYTLDGQMMLSSSASKLLEPMNFSPIGTYPNTLTIVNGFVDSNSLASINTINDVDLLFFGFFDKNNASLISFTETELDSLHKWSMNGGKMIIAGSAPSGPLLDWNVDSSILDSRWGFDITFDTNATIVASAEGLNSVLFNGPFGAPQYVTQGGSIKGYFNVIPNNSIVLSVDWIGNPTLILDCKTLDLIIADVDVYTMLGNVSNGGLISTDNDILWANSIVYMDMLQNQPIITQSGAILSTSLYNSYQWYHDSIPIPNSNVSSYDMMGQTGTYHVEVSLDCGCDNVASNAITILSLGGCTYEGACNFNEVANFDDGSCEYEGCAVMGCTYQDADNYNSEATEDNGSCSYDSAFSNTFANGYEAGLNDCPECPPTSDSCHEDLNGDGAVSTPDLLIFLSAFGLTC